MDVTVTHSVCTTTLQNFVDTFIVFKVFIPQTITWWERFPTSRGHGRGGDEIGAPGSRLPPQECGTLAADPQDDNEADWKPRVPSILSGVMDCGFTLGGCIDALWSF